MIKILRHSSYALAITIGFALLYIRGFSQTILYFNAAIILVIAIAEMALKYGFTKDLPKQKFSTTINRLIRYGFGIFLCINAEKILNQDIFESLLSSKRFIVALWLWIMVEIFFELLKDLKKKTFQPVNSADPKGRAAD